MFVCAVPIDLELKPLSLNRSCFRLLCGREKHMAALGDISKEK